MRRPSNTTCIWIIAIIMILQAVVITHIPTHKVGILDCIPRR